MWCIDGALVNRSVSQYNTLGAENLDLVKEDGLIQGWLYELQVEHFLTSENAFVVEQRRHCVSAVLGLHSRERFDPSPARGWAEGLYTCQFPPAATLVSIQGGRIVLLPIESKSVP